MDTPPLAPGLYIVATPIGNLGDITARAADILARCDVIACEDTRVTGKLLNHLGIRKAMRRYDDHASADVRERLLGEMAEKSVVLVSDAGTPLISDPGYRLVREARELGLAVTSVPGPSAMIVALTLAGLPTDRFMFAGFLPSKDKARGDVLAELAATPATLVFYETGPRLVASLTAMEQHLPGRELAVARELTKLHEECRSGTPEELIAHYSAHPPKGEIVLLAGPPPAPAAPAGDDVDTLLRAALEHLSPSQAAGQVAKAHGLDRKALYARAMALKEAP
ncbi:MULTISPECIES: 16S rRNA (cytidine(1402)-2'-O)-methyltransferase [unclassified Novosphingobium]|uniref:16S rRNA (cytidine(1402)-2'-O)-methyltransferase n=1 Tax=unclassified Novosphingobium TaxID=2644732 RepID=UPI000D3145BE|nr:MULTISPECIES: 16S rRNA (cytidine(1402)-2'-O)-methyltransferase [unclassified Novosphingobium]PTR12627.1 16S rRNA (cytidine1402-2'-O)-methyltransferase [Novosphingobium sp. GV055]PUB06411.1 16S rRNA (cytidine1402-2'-O)-methyltransferase [Novosphingobium sp. GV061]PUB22462.1 16S rRNA (cytidine1402-2'-O)-methyltransferase [Novosphingobium sp. GV079]PUB44487.1 16S rRNA (cytidine1402-2'-O)-methyltransferase [Novosphingobium sp. GV027]